MKKLAAVFNEKFLNGGTTIVLMGMQWFYLWIFPWYKTYLQDPYWGHNYVMSLAFLAVGLAYFNRKLLSDILSVPAAALVIPASLSLFPHHTTAIASAILVLLIILDMIIERKHLLFKISSSGPVAWMRNYLLCISFVLLASIAPSYFLIEVSSGTCDFDIDTILFDSVLIPFLLLLLLEKLPAIENKVVFRRMGFFWGMITMVVVLGLMLDQPEVFPNFIFTTLVTAFGFFSLFMGPKPASLPSR